MRIHGDDAQSRTVEELRVFTARGIHTMEPGSPTASAVAVSGDRIVEAGSLETLRPWLDTHPHEIDTTFADMWLMPGFIDPHVHPFLAATTLTNDIAAPDAWKLPDSDYPAVLTPEDHRARLAELHAAWADPAKVQVVWGYQPFWHGKLTRSNLDEIADSPLVVLHRSVHEAILNSAALDLFDFSDAELAAVDGYFDLDAGHFFEAAMMQLVAKRLPEHVDLQQLPLGLDMFCTLATRGGVTTAADVFAGGIAGIDAEWELARTHLGGDDAGLRTLFVAAPLQWMLTHGDKTFDVLEARRRESTDKLLWPKAVKTFFDGAFISQLFCTCFPGYIDGHKGQWIAPPEFAQPVLEPYWEAGYDIYCHVNGDEGIDRALDLLDELQSSCPRRDFRFSLEHFGISREDQVTRIAELGASVSINGYYLNLFGDKYAEVGLGYERTSQMTRLGSLARNDVPFTMHSDLPMGPLEPLRAVSTAVTRRTSSGQVLGPDQAVSLDAALRAVTIDAAWSWRLDRDLGSIAPGKIADFAVLSEDPCAVASEDIGDIEIWGTVFEGTPHEA